jgi:hypothetical protein
VVAWIGSGGTIDGTPLEFYFWGYVKNKVYIPTLPTSLEELRARIREAVATIDTDTKRLTDGTSAA